MRLWGGRAYAVSGQRRVRPGSAGSWEYCRKVLVGRGLEQARLAELVELARHGSAGCLVVRGEPGVGKTALLEELIGDAGEALVLRTQGLEVEAPLAFAALHRLLRPVMRLREQLPAPQARALRVAFGEEDGPSVEPFLVAVATLSMLAAAAEERLVLCVVDDAHWLDPATADALVFCGHRIGADRVLIVFSARDGAGRPFRPEGLAEMVLAGLDLAAARALLDERLGATPPGEVTERLIAETGGNPLALLELPTELSAAQLRGSSPLPAQLHLTARVERVFLDRSRRLPAPVQSILLLAAADDTGELAVIRSAAADLGADEHALEAAVGSGLLVTDALAVKVRHPLVRSAIYQAATGAERRRGPRRLTEQERRGADPTANAGDGHVARPAFHAVRGERGGRARGSAVLSGSASIHAITSVRGCYPGSRSDVRGERDLPVDLAMYDSDWSKWHPGGWIGPPSG